MKLKLICCALLLCLLSGCGYTYKSVISEKYKTLYVKTFANKIDITDKITSKNPYKIYRPGTEQDITNAVIHRFIYDGTLKITRQDEADLVLTGDLVDYQRAPLRYDENYTNVLEYRVSITVDITLKNAKTGETLINAQRIISDKTFATSGQFQATEIDALNLATEDLSRKIVEKTVELGW